MKYLKIKTQITTFKLQSAAAVVAAKQTCKILVTNSSLDGNNNLEHAHY